MKIYITKNTISKILSLALIIFYLSVSLKNGGGEAFLSMLIFCIVPFYAIWYADTMGKAKGFLGPTGGHPQINTHSPQKLVIFLGWVILLIPIFISIYQASFEN